MFEIELDEGSPSMRKLKLPYDKTSELFGQVQVFQSGSINVLYMYLYCQQVTKKQQKNI